MPSRKPKTSPGPKGLSDLLSFDVIAKREPRRARVGRKATVPDVETTKWGEIANQLSETKLALSRIQACLWKDDVVWAHEAAGEAIGHLVEMQKHLDFLSMARHLGTNAPAMTISEILEREG